MRHHAFDVKGIKTKGYTWELDHTFGSALDIKQCHGFGDILYLEAPNALIKRSADGTYSTISSYVTGDTNPSLQSIDGHMYWCTSNGGLTSGILYEINADDTLSLHESTNYLGSGNFLVNESYLFWNHRKSGTPPAGGYTCRRDGPASWAWGAGSGYSAQSKCENWIVGQGIPGYYVSWAGTGDYLTRTIIGTDPSDSGGDCRQVGVQDETTARAFNGGTTLWSLSEITPGGWSTAAQPALAALEPYAKYVSCYHTQGILFALGSITGSPGYVVIAELPDGGEWSIGWKEATALSSWGWFSRAGNYLYCIGLDKVWRRSLV